MTEDFAKMIMSELDRVRLATERVEALVLADREHVLSKTLEKNVGRANAIISLAEKHFGLPMGTIRRRGREEHIVLARFAAIYIARQVTDLTTLQLARLFNYKDHASIYFGEQSCKDRMDTDWKYKETVVKLAQRFMAVDVARN